MSRPRGALADPATSRHVLVNPPSSSLAPAVHACCEGACLPHGRVPRAGRRAGPLHGGGGDEERQASVSALQGLV